MLGRAEPMLCNLSCHDSHALSRHRARRHVLNVETVASSAAAFRGGSKGAVVRSGKGHLWGRPARTSAIYTTARPRRRGGEHGARSSCCRSTRPSASWTACAMWSTCAQHRAAGARCLANDWMHAGTHSLGALLKAYAWCYSPSDSALPSSVLACAAASRKSAPAAGTGCASAIDTDALCSGAQPEALPASCPGQQVEVAFALIAE